MYRARVVWAAALIALVAVPAAAQQGADDLWEVTTKMEMAGMPFAMPAQTNQVCLQKGRQEEGVVPQDKNCRLEDMRRSGNRTTFRMVCEGKDRMTGDVDITSTGDSYQGTMRMQGTSGGQSMNMTNNFSGRKIGACTWQDPAKQQRDTMAAGCRRAVDELQWYAVTTDQAMCKEYQGAFCSRVVQVAGEMREPAGFDSWTGKRSDMPQVLQVCGQDLNSVQAAACDRASATRNWSFLIKRCEAQARQIAGQRCAGRDYTAIMASEYGPLCQRFPAGRSATPVAVPPAVRPLSPAQAPAAMPQAPAQVPAPPTPPAATATPAPAPDAGGSLDKVDRTINKLKGLFGR